MGGKGREGEAHKTFLHSVILVFIALLMDERANGRAMGATAETGTGPGAGPGAGGRGGERLNDERTSVHSNASARSCDLCCRHAGGVPREAEFGSF